MYTAVSTTATTHRGTAGKMRWWLWLRYIDRDDGGGWSGACWLLFVRWRRDWDDSFIHFTHSMNHSLVQHQMYISNQPNFYRITFKERERKFSRGEMNGIHNTSYARMHQSYRHKLDIFSAVDSAEQSDGGMKSVVSLSSSSSASQSWWWWTTTLLA